MAATDGYAPEMQDPGDGDMFGVIAEAAAKATYVTCPVCMGHAPACDFCGGRGAVEGCTSAASSCHGDPEIDECACLAKALREWRQAPPRGELSPEVATAAAHIHPHVWGEPYRPGEGPMHHAGGPYWHDELLLRADRWERLAQSARICAEALPKS